jgi:hypothetical protein
VEERREKTSSPASAHVSTRQHASAYVSIRQHTSAYVGPTTPVLPAYVSIRQHTSDGCQLPSLKANLQVDS